MANQVSPPQTAEIHVCPFELTQTYKLVDGPGEDWLFVLRLFFR